MANTIRAYMHSVAIADKDSTAKNPRTKAYQYPIIRSEDGPANPHKDEVLFAEGGLSEVAKKVSDYGIKVLNDAGRVGDTDYYSAAQVQIAGLNDTATLRLDPSRWTDGSATRDGSGLKIARFVDKLWASKARGVDKFTETSKAIPADLYDRVIAKLSSEGEAGVKLSEGVKVARAK